jgi:hypothetical protein
MGNGRRLIFVMAVMLLTLVGAAAVQAQPSGIYVSPGDGQRDVSPGSYVRVSFQEPMDTTSVEAALTISPPVAGAFQWDGDGRYLMYLPAEPLPPQHAVPGSPWHWHPNTVGPAGADASVPVAVRYP